MADTYAHGPRHPLTVNERTSGKILRTVAHEGILNTAVLTKLLSGTNVDV